MRLIRFACVVILAAAGIGGVGALIGSCVGFALPSGAKVTVSAEGRRAGTAGGDDKTVEATNRREVEAGVSVGDGLVSDRASSGAAMGLAVGLIIGLPAGLVLAVLDQLFIIFRLAIEARKDEASPDS
jgi:hypothetical protein